MSSSASTPSPRTPFRPSTYLDFNSGVVLKPPMDVLKATKKPWSLPKKITLFESRVEVWQIGVAAEMLREIETNQPPSIWSHAAYGLVAVAFSYFEMLGKTLNPNSHKSKTAGEDFNWGFCDVYTSFKPKNGIYTDKLLPHTGPGVAPSNPDIALVVAFRNRIRNGMYHLAYTKRGLRLHDDDSLSAEDFSSRREQDPYDRRKKMTMYYMNPHRTIRTIVAHFPGFIGRLRKPNNTALRQKFEEFFDEFHKVD